MADGAASRDEIEGTLDRITLYGPARAPFTEKVRRALLFKRLAFELREPAGPEDYRRWNPQTGLLPVLDLDGERIPDSTDILYRIDAAFPDPPLLSRDPRVAGRQRQLEEWADENLLWHFNRWQRLREQASATAPRASGGWQRLVQRAAPLRRLLAWLAAGGTWERPQTALLRGLGDRLDDLVNFLGARPFFYSESVSMADLAVYAMLHTMQREAIPGTAPLLARRPMLLEFMRRVEAETDGKQAE